MKILLIIILRFDNVIFKTKFTQCITYDQMLRRLKPRRQPHASATLNSCLSIRSLLEDAKEPRRAQSRQGKERKLFEGKGGREITAAAM